MAYMNALVNGYEAEPSKEEKLQKFLSDCGPSEREAVLTALRIAGYEEDAGENG